MLTDLTIPALDVWRLYRGRADCENRIKELKADFGLDSFVLRDFWDRSPGKSEKETFRLAVARKRRPWFEGLWANAGEPLAFADSAQKS
jgi:hypothetical protein